MYVHFRKLTKIKSMFFKQKMLIQKMLSLTNVSHKSIVAINCRFIGHQESICSSFKELRHHSQLQHPQGDPRLTGGIRP